MGGKDLRGEHAEDMGEKGGRSVSGERGEGDGVTTEACQPCSLWRTPAFPCQTAEKDGHCAGKGSSPEVDTQYMPCASLH